MAAEIRNWVRIPGILFKRPWKEVFCSLGRPQRIALLALPVLLALGALSLVQALAKSASAVHTLHFRIHVRDMLSPPNPRQADHIRVPLTELALSSPQSRALEEVIREGATRQDFAHSQASAGESRRGDLPEGAVATANASARAGLPLASQPGTGSGSGLGGDYYVDLKVRRGESLTSLLGRYNIGPGIIHRLSMLPDTGKYLRSLRPGNEIGLFFDRGHRLRGLKYQIDNQRYLDIKASGDGFKGRIDEYPTEVRIAYAEAQIESSLFYSGHRAGLTDKTIAEFAAIFSWDIDFARDLRPGDRFEVMYENKYVNGKFIGSGHILRARIYNRSRWLDGIRFERNGRAEYFSPAGVNLRRAFIRNPLDPSLISSRYSRRRLHPVLKTVRPHTGVDYAAPTNTPIRATGYGTVSFRGTKGGYGKTVIVSHGKKYQTLYAHMNRFVKSVRVGTKVSQGQVIGYVGSTGLSTGPHLHYEFRINGKHTDPLEVRLPSAQPLRGESRRLFRRQLSRVQADFALRRDEYRGQAGKTGSSLAGL